MTDKKIIEEMAKIEFGDRFDGVSTDSKSCIWDIDENGAIGWSIRDYLNDHNACQRVIDGMKSNSQRRDYVYALDDMIHKGTVEPFYAHHVADIVVATPRQKCEAILKAANKWEG